MTDFLKFINNHINYFKKYDTIDDVDNITERGWLYIFSAFCYEKDITQILPENTDKFGQTTKMIFERLQTYKKHVKMTNIESINCTFPEERERLIKAYLKQRININPIAGLEYYSNSRILIKVLMLIIVYISDDEIISYEKSYSENDIRYNEIFDKIDDYLKVIKDDENFELKIENNSIPIEKENIPPLTFNCNFCKKSYTSQSNLNNHQKTAKFCLDLQNKLSSGELIRCEYCLKEFATKKYLQQHIEICKQKKNVEQNDLKKDLENLKNDLENLKNENIKLKLKLEMKDEIIKNLEKINKGLLGSLPSRKTNIIK
jgi:hypothetical protein